LSGETLTDAGLACGGRKILHREQIEPPMFENVKKRYK
jgi:hypothetical protein